MKILVQKIKNNTAIVLLDEILTDATPGKAWSSLQLGPKSLMYHRTASTIAAWCSSVLLSPSLVVPASRSFVSFVMLSKGVMYSGAFIPEQCCSCSSSISNSVSIEVTSSDTVDLFSNPEKTFNTT